jgi:hypothetical protein
MDTKLSVKSRSISPIASRSRTICTEPVDDWKQFNSPEFEKKEVSSTLSYIRKLHDSAKESNIKKRIYIDRLRKELEKSKGLTSTFQNNHKEMQSKIEAINQDLEITRLKFEEEVKSRTIYQHVLDRMKLNKLSMEKQANDLRGDLRKSVFILGTENEKLRRAKESRHKLRSTIHDLRQSLDAEKKTKMMELEQLQKTVRMRSEALLRREQREKRHEQIAEAMLDFDKASDGMMMREAILINRFWFRVLDNKANVIAKNAEKHERAFAAIRSCTNTSTVEGMVNSFLTRETDYALLLRDIDEAEKKLEEMKRENVRVNKEFNEIQLLSGIDMREYREIAKFDVQVEETEQMAVEQNKRMERYAIVYDKFSAWAVRMARLLQIPDANTVTPSTSYSWSDETLYKLFLKLSDKIAEMSPSIEIAEVSDSDWDRITQELEFGIRTQTEFSRLNRIRLESTQEESESDVI